MPPRRKRPPPSSAPSTSMAGPSRLPYDALQAKTEDRPPRQALAEGQGPFLRLPFLLPPPNIAPLRSRPTPGDKSPKRPSPRTSRSPLPVASSSSAPSSPASSSSSFPSPTPHPSNPTSYPGSTRAPHNRRYDTDNFPPQFGPRTDGEQGAGWTELNCWSLHGRSSCPRGDDTSSARPSSSSSSYFTASSSTASFSNNNDINGDPSPTPTSTSTSPSHTSTTSASPSSTQDSDTLDMSTLPKGWGNKVARTNLYRVPVIVVCSVLLAAAIVGVIGLCAYMRTRRRARIRAADLEDEKFRPSPESTKKKKRNQSGKPKSRWRKLGLGRRLDDQQLDQPGRSRHSMSATSIVIDVEEDDDEARSEPQLHPASAMSASALSVSSALPNARPTTRNLRWRGSRLLGPFRASSSSSRRGGSGRSPAVPGGTSIANAANSIIATSHSSHSAHHLEEDDEDDEDDEAVSCSDIDPNEAVRVPLGEEEEDVSRLRHQRPPASIASWVQNHPAGGNDEDSASIMRPLSLRHEVGGVMDTEEGEDHRSEGHLPNDDDLSDGGDGLDADVHPPAYIPRNGNRPLSRRRRASRAQNGLDASQADIAPARFSLSVSDGTSANLEEYDGMAHVATDDKAMLARLGRLRSEPPLPSASSSHPLSPPFSPGVDGQMHSNVSNEDILVPDEEMLVLHEHEQALRDHDSELPRTPSHPHSQLGSDPRHSSRSGVATSSLPPKSVHDALPSHISRTIRAPSPAAAFSDDDDNGDDEIPSYAESHLHSQPSQPSLHHVGTRQALYPPSLPLPVVHEATAREYARLAAASGAGKEASSSSSVAATLLPFESSSHPGSHDPLALGSAGAVPLSSALSAPYDDDEDALSASAPPLEEDEMDGALGVASAPPMPDHDE
ncbi:hypothetical protein DL93DRAFT_59096 [Clavulina sp. PMI_390]|nr:hypothetical protein DL93DRAFT_59096 [Clavulina sp. PMI_390]